MAKKVSKKASKKTDASLEIKTPYPKEKKKINEVYHNLGKLPPLGADSDYWGEKMVKLQDRINELELTVNSMHLKLNRVADRMGF